MKVLIFGSRSLTWKHLPVFRALALHAVVDFSADGGFSPRAVLDALLAGAPPTTWHRISGSLTLINGDGPPGKERGAVGADKLALLACMEAWPEAQRRVRWFKPEEVQKADPTISWARAAAARDIAMADATPDRSYVVHTDLDSSRGSIITAQALTERGLPFWHVRVTQAGALVSVEERKP